MISAFSRGSTAIFLCTFSANITHADISAQDVWSDWRAYMLGTGYEISGTEQMSGDTLTVSDTMLAIDLPEDAVRFEMRLGDLSFTENGDGTVAVNLPNVMPIMMSGTNDSDEPFEAILNYTQTGFSMVASGDPEDMTYNYTAASVGLNLDQVTVNNEVFPPDMAAFEMTMANITGTTRMQGGDMRTYTQRAETDGLSYDLMINDPEGEGELVFRGSSDTVGFESVSTLPEMMDPDNMAAMIDAGFAGDGSVSFGPGNSLLTFEEGAETFSYESTSEGGLMSATLSPEGIGYVIEQNDLSVNIAGSEIPLPISLNMAEIVFDMLIPVMEGEDPQEFGLTMVLGDFTMSDLIWGIFDPTGQLPRDPATIVVDLSGMARVLADLFDPEVAAQMESGPPPAELTALTVTELEVTAAGASLTGSGDFTFDNTDVTTFDGLPRPTGAMDLRLVGGNGLLDKLVAMGLLPEDQAGGARMMMGLFAVPGDGEDTLNSRLEINDEGHILANGQRIQ